MERFELSRPYEHWVLNPACLPFHHIGIFCTASRSRTCNLPIRSRMRYPVAPWQHLFRRGIVSCGNYPLSNVTTPSAYLVHLEGFKPPLSWFEAKRSVQLKLQVRLMISMNFLCTDDRSRTCMN